MIKKCEKCKKETEHHPNPIYKDGEAVCVVCWPGAHTDWPKNLTDDDLISCVWASDMFPENVDALDAECKRRGIDPFEECKDGK